MPKGRKVPETVPRPPTEVLPMVADTPMKIIKADRRFIAGHQQLIHDDCQSGYATSGRGGLVFDLRQPIGLQAPAFYAAGADTTWWEANGGPIIAEGVATYDPTLECVVALIGQPDDPTDQSTRAYRVPLTALVP